MNTKTSYSFKHRCKTGNNYSQEKNEKTLIYRGFLDVTISVNSTIRINRTLTAIGGWVENTKTIEIIILKELGKNRITRYIVLGESENERE